TPRTLSHRHHVKDPFVNAYGRLRVSAPTAQSSFVLHREQPRQTNTPYATFGQSRAGSILTIAKVHPKRRVPSCLAIFPAERLFNPNRFGIFLIFVAFRRSYAKLRWVVRGSYVERSCHESNSIRIAASDHHGDARRGPFRAWRSCHLQY